MDYLLRGVLIGLLFGLPVGAVGTITVWRTWNGGIKAGLFTGLGSSAADCFYACVGAFGLTLISDFLLKYQIIINILGGSFILLMGVAVFRRKQDVQKQMGQTERSSSMFLTSFLVGITNPAAILTFLFAFSYFRITGWLGISRSIALVAGVFIGTYIWWGALFFATDFLRKKTGNVNFQKANKIFGSLLILFGIVIFMQTFLAAGKEDAKMRMSVQVGGAVFSATLEDNEAVSELVAMMQESPVAIEMSDTRLGHIDDLAGWEDALGRSL